MIRDHLSWAAHPERFGLLLPHPVLTGGAGASASSCAASWLCPQRRASHPLAPHGEKMRAQEGLGGVRVWTLGRVGSWEESEVDVNWLVGENHKGSLRGAALGIPNHLQRSSHVGNFLPFCPPSCPPLPCFRKLGTQTLEFHLLFLSSSSAGMGEAKLEAQACRLRVPFGRFGFSSSPSETLPGCQPRAFPCHPGSPECVLHHHLLPPASSSNLVPLPPSTLTLVPIRGSGHHRTKLRSACLHPA